MTPQCELCGRHDVETTIHHLTPKEEGGTFMPTVNLCIPCHKQIHSLYTNRDIVQLQLNTLQALREDVQIRSYIRWIRKQPSSAIPRTRKSRNVRRK